MCKLKADRLHPHDYSTHRPWTDNDSFLLLFSALGKAEPQISTTAHQKFEIDLWPWPLTLTPTFDLDLTLKQNTIFCIWPWPLTYDPDLQCQSSQCQSRPSYQKGQMSISWAVRVLTEGLMDGRYQVYYLSALRLIINDRDSMVKGLEEVLSQANAWLWVLQVLRLVHLQRSSTDIFDSL